MVLPAVLAALAVVVLLTRPAGAAQRLAAAVPVVRPARVPARSPAAAACALAGVACAVLVGWPAGLVPGLVVALAGPRLLARLEPRAARDQRARLVADLPLILDLLAACLAGGAALPAAATAVAAALPGPCADRLGAAARALTVGLTVADAWLLLSGGDPEDPLAPAARMLARAAEGGMPVSGAVARLAADARADSRAAAEQAARRVGVLVVAPLGLCFLPAFVLLGVVPVVVGLAAPLLALG
jgi:pilus assembly protein TadC